MNRKPYCTPQVLDHQPLVFETLISCDPPNMPAETTDGNVQICLRPDNTWFPR